MNYEYFCVDPLRMREEESNNDIAIEDTGIGYIKLATLNIIDARQAGLNATSPCMKQMNVDIAILTETKLTNNKYTRRSSGYSIIATKAEGINCGGVALLYRTEKNWLLESTKTFGPNVIRATIVLS